MKTKPTRRSQTVTPPETVLGSEAATKTEPLNTSSLKLWQKRYLAALQAGAGQEAAVKVANVSTGVIAEWTNPDSSRYDPVFARAHAQVVAGVAVMGVTEARALAAAAAPNLIADALALSRNRDPETGEVMQEPLFNKDGEVVGHRDAVKPRDRLQAQRLVHEVAGSLASHGDGGTLKLPSNGNWELALRYRGSKAEEPGPHRA